MPASPRTTTRLALAALVAVTLVWGLTFVVVKQALEHIPPFEFLSLRFGIAALALAALLPRGLPLALRKRTLLAGLPIAGALVAGYAFQTVGLQYTSATQAGFITGLFVIFTPLVAAVLLRTKPTWTALGCVALATLGLWLLIGAGPLTPGAGDVLVLACALSFAFHIVLLGKHAPAHDVRALTLVQLALTALAFTLLTLSTERLVLPTSGHVWFALLLTALGASAFAFLAQTWAQRHLTPTTTAITLTLEPVFAGIAGYWLLSERLTPAGWLGAALILAAMLAMETWGTPKTREPSRNAQEHEPLSQPQPPQGPPHG